MRYIILCFILIIQVSILTGCNYYVPKTIKIKENAYTLDKHHFMHIKNIKFFKNKREKDFETSLYYYYVKILI